MLFLSICILFFLSIASASWISVQLPSGSWVAVQEIVPKKRYLMHPQAFVANVIFAKGCSRYSPTVIEVRFWEQNMHKIIETALKDQGICFSEDSCRLEPYQARYVLIRDQFNVWKPVRYRRSIPVTLPPTMRFDLVRYENSSCLLLSPRDLSGLVFEFRGIGGQNRPDDIVIEANISRLLDQIKPEMNSNKTSEKEIQLQKEINNLKAQLAMQNIDQSLAISCPAEQSEKAVSSQTQNISDCLYVKLCNLKEGYYFVRSLGQKAFCTSLGEMLVYKRTRGDYATFNQKWYRYERGIGRAKDKNYFMGLRAMRRYTASGDKCMTVYLVPKNESLPPRNGQYSNFVIGSSFEGYKLFYNKYSGTLTKDPFSYHKKRFFTTIDRKKSLSIGCAKSYKGGGWYVSCFEIGLFGFPGPKAPRAFSSKGLSKQNKNDHVDLVSAFMTLRSVSGDPKALKTVFSDYSTVCPTRVQVWMVPESGEYVITAGGAPGGTSSHIGSSPGGRGALVRLRLFLKKRTILRIVVGCAGDVGYFSGSGGDGSFVADHYRRKLLAAAGGGGGAGWMAGGHGRQSESGGEAKLSPSRPLGLGKASLKSAGNWGSIMSNMFGVSNYTASTGSPSFSDKNPKSSSGGGGGGGYQGGSGANEEGFAGERMEPVHSAGGGGGSLCDSSSAKDCEIIEGGNSRSQGFVTIQTYRCFDEEYEP